MPNISIKIKFVRAKSNFLYKDFYECQYARVKAAISTFHYIKLQTMHGNSQIKHISLSFLLPITLFPKQCKTLQHLPNHTNSLKCAHSELQLIITKTVAKTLIMNVYIHGNTSLQRFFLRFVGSSAAEMDPDSMSQEHSDCQSSSSLLLLAKWSSMYD